MKKIFLALILAITSTYASTLDENVTAVEQASSQIDAAIRAKRGTTAGGLKNAATGIMSIPDNVEPFSQEYAVIDTEYYVNVITNYADCQYVDYIQFIGKCYFNTKIIPTANTIVECEVQLPKSQALDCLFGSSMENDSNQFRLISARSSNSNNYTEVEYIQSDGGQWLDTGITDFRDETLVIEISDLVYSIYYQCIMGTGENYCTSDALFAALVGNGNYIWLYSGVNANIWSADYNNSGDRCIITLRYNQCKVENITKGTTTQGDSSTTELALSSRSFCIFKGDTTDSNLCQTGLKGKIYSFKSNHTDMIPVIDANGVACMYDKIGNRFFYNQGTGNFTAGPSKDKFSFSYMIDNDIGSNAYQYDNDKKYRIKANNKKCYIYEDSTNLVAELVSSGNDVNCVNPMGLFCCLAGESCLPINIMQNIKFYSFKVYDNDNLICHLIPVRIKNSLGKYSIPKLVDLTNGRIFDGPYTTSDTVVELNLNDQWQEKITDWTPSEAMLQNYILAESFSNWNKHNQTAIMYIKVDYATEFSFYINSYAESHFDFTRAYAVDNESEIISTTSDYQYNPSLYMPESGTGWKKVTYQLDGDEHTIKVDYAKDSSANIDFDRGFIAIPRDLMAIYGEATNQTTVIDNIISNIDSKFVAYSTNIVGAAQNKIIIDDAANKIYNSMLDIK